MSIENLQVLTSAVSQLEPVKQDGSAMHFCFWANRLTKTVAAHYVALPPHIAESLRLSGQSMERSAARLSLAAELREGGATVRQRLTALGSGRAAVA
jgi:hypothetical protein